MHSALTTAAAAGWRGGGVAMKRPLQSFSSSRLSSLLSPHLLPSRSPTTFAGVVRRNSVTKTTTSADNFLSLRCWSSSAATLPELLLDRNDNEEMASRQQHQETQASDAATNAVTTMTTAKTTDEPPPSQYEEWVRRLYQTNLFHPVKMGLDNIQLLHELLGNPMDQTTVIHIAGTNGKGSVALKIAQTLQLAQPQKRIGLFCSPHVSSFRERCQVNSQLITEQQVVELLPPLYALCQEHDIPATFFEMTTALAFSFFAQHRCDVVVLETGLGGRLDATNVVKQPALTIITSIGLEHTRILGDTIEKIALEKGGIIKPHCPVLVGPHVPHDVLRKCAHEKQASAYYISEEVLNDDSASSANGVFVDYDLENARIAKAALQLLQQSHPEVIRILDQATIEEGTSQRPPCRFEQVQLGSDQTVILDVAHNPPAIDYMVQKLQSTFSTSKFRIVIGMSSDKDLTLCGSSILQAVQGDASRVHLVQAAHPRAAPLEQILEAKPEFVNRAHYDEQDRSITRQIKTALQLLAEDEILVVCGSVFIMAEAREALGFVEPRDSPYIAEVAGAGVRNSQENFANTSTTMPPPPPPPP